MCLDRRKAFWFCIEFSKEKTQKQINRYTEAYGQGAIIYRHGFCDGLNFQGAQKLDAGPVDLSLLIEHNDNRS